MVQAAVDSDGSALHKLAMLISSGFESHHKSTVNGYVKMWNNTFGTLETVQYPENVQNALKRLRPFVELRLPGFPLDENSEVSKLEDHVSHQA